MKSKFFTLSSFLWWTASITIVAMDKPNILWLSSEDHGPHLGCYGDAYATTPNIDAFAERGYRYNKASSNAPVCAPARTTIISGMYPPSTGSQHMRSRAPAPSFLKFFPLYLKETGYYTTNNSKEDYNLTTHNKGWDESSRKAHWNNRPEGKPFFAVFNFTGTHESRIRNKNPNPVHDPALATLAPYLPDIPEVRKDWAQYYDRLTEADQFFGMRMKELEEAGLSEETIVFFWADHGSGMPRSKRYPGWSGLHVPLIVHFPNKWAHLAPKGYEEGGNSDRLVAFIDFAPTMLSLAGVTIPDYYHGHAFAGDQQTEDPPYSFGFRGRMDERADFVRSITDGRYLYMRNFYRHLPHGQFVHYQQQTPTTAVWYRKFLDGELDAVQSAFWEPRPREELYDLENDYHSVNNLAESDQHQPIKNRLRQALDEHMAATGDLGFLPEPILRQIILSGTSPAESDRTQLGHAPTWGNVVLKLRDLERELPGNLGHPVPERRYWILMQLLAEGPGIAYDLNEHLLEKALDDAEPIVAVAAAECLGRFSSREDLREKAIATLMRYATFPDNEFILSIHALNALDHLKNQGRSLPEKAGKLTIEHEKIPSWGNSYRRQLINRL